MILVLASHDQTLLTERRAGLPMVFIDRAPSLLDAMVLSNNRDGACDGVLHLLAHGHRSVGYLGDLTTISTAQERWDGYRDALRQHSIAVEPRLVRQDLRTIFQAEQAALEILGQDPPPTALFASQNLVTIGAIRALRQLGKHHEIALVGFDDFMLADLLEPAVSVIAQDPGRMGGVAAQTLFDRLGGEPRVHGTSSRPGSSSAARARSPCVDRRLGRRGSRDCRRRRRRGALERWRPAAHQPGRQRRQPP